MDYIKKCIVSVLEKDIYKRDLHGLGVIIGMVIKKFIKDDEDGYSKSDFLKGINEGLSKDPENIKTA
jgi:hypothetical protein